MKKLDLLDLRILQIITMDARIPFKDVAEACGVSRAAVHQRVLRLTDGGVITGSGYSVYPKQIGFSTCTYVGIKLERGSMYKAVAVELEKIREIVECHFTTGPYTMLIKLFSRDNQHLMELLNHHIQQIPGVVSTETLISLEQTFARQVPVAIPDEDLAVSSKKVEALMERVSQEEAIEDDMEESVEEVAKGKKGK